VERSIKIFIELIKLQNYFFPNHDSNGYINGATTHTVMRGSL